jgi:hypothetical protein
MSHGNEFLEFQKEFDEEKCRDYLFRLRWPDGFRCPKPDCGHDKKYDVKPIGYKFKCKKCRKTTSIVDGTILRRPLYRWFWAIRYVTFQPGMGSAAELQRSVGLGSRHTALDWFDELSKMAIYSEQYNRNGKITFDELLENIVGSQSMIDEDFL